MVTILGDCYANSQNFSETAHKKSASKPAALEREPV